MAIYHLHCQIIGRSGKTEIKADGTKGSKHASMASAVASAAYRAGTMLKESIIEAVAYRSGERLQEQQSAKYHDYRFKGGVVHSEIMLPPHAPPEYRDRQTLWNAVEAVESTKDAQLAREFNIALHNELSMSRNLALIREYVQTNFVDKGMCADIAIHNPKRRSKVDNLHAHVMLTMRPINLDGSWGQKARKEYIYDNAGNHILDDKGRWKSRSVHLIDWNKHSTFLEWRKSWADLSNTYFERAGLDLRISEMSYEELGIDLTPTKHMGKEATALERKGIITERGEENRAIAARNAQRLKELFGFSLVTAAELVSQKVHELSFAANRQPTESQYVQTELYAEQQQIDHSQELPPGMDSERRTYTPASGVVRQGIPLHPKEAVFEPPDARKDVPRLSGNKETGIADPALTKQGLRMPVRAALRGSIGQTLRLDLSHSLQAKTAVYVRSRRQVNESLQHSARVLRFITDNKITSLSQLEHEVRQMERSHQSVSADISRLDDIGLKLEKLKSSAEICQTNRDVVEQYNGKKLFKEAFYKKYKSEIDGFIEAQSILRRTGRYDENTKPAVFEDMLTAQQTKRAYLVAQVQALDDKITLYRIRRTEIRELLGVKPEPARTERESLEQKLQRASKQVEQRERSVSHRTIEKEIER